MRILSTIRPTQTQLTIIAKIVASQEVPARAAAEISTNSNFIAARNILMKLGIIVYTDKSANLTEKGQMIAKEQNITNDSGQLTDEGNKLASVDSNGSAGKTQQEPAQSDMGIGPSDLDLPPMEGFSELFKTILNG